MRLIENKNFIGVKSTNSNETCALGFGDLEDVVIINCIIDGGDADWGLKLSKCFNVTFQDCIIKNGTERAFDAVRGGEFKFDRCKFLIDNGSRTLTDRLIKFKKTCDIGLKAGVRDVIFTDCEMSDLLLGDYSIYDQIDRPPTRRIQLIRCKNPNGGPIFIRGYHVESDSIIAVDTKIKKLIYPKLIVKLYWWICRTFGDKRIISDTQFIISEKEKK